MVSELCDTHVNSWYIPIFGGRFVPLMCEFAEDRLFVTDTCSLVANNFKIGDEIILIEQMHSVMVCDIVVEPTVEGMIRSVDEQQQAAINYQKGGYR